MTDSNPRGQTDRPANAEEAADRGRPAYVRPVVQTFSAEEILAEFGPAQACSGTSPCPTE